jgi:hypothetical protein
MTTYLSTSNLEKAKKSSEGMTPGALLVRFCILLFMPMLMGFGTCSSSYPQGAPDDDGFDFGYGPPEEGAPTGTRWVEAPLDDGCGRQGRTWVLGDEVCSGTDGDDYMAAFTAPMFRDGVLIGDRLFTVDATHLWVLDVHDPAKVVRTSLISGLGRPLAVEEHDGNLIIASGDAGLVAADVSDPLRPELLGRVLLPGPAMGVDVSDGVAYVAAGEAGLSLVDLGTLTLLETIDVPGFAASVDVAGGLAYVAACRNLVVVDPEAGVSLGSAWLEDALPEHAPAKDVEVVDQVAFVAAGRYGVVAVDVSDSRRPAVIGNCTIPTELNFYASGVRSDEGYLVVAGGEWGILSLGINSPSTVCSGLQIPRLMSAPDDGTEGDCTEVPPWEALDWQELWEPPPPGHDPVQVLPVDGLVYAFGDAMRVGLRAVDIYRFGSGGTLQSVGRYDEPRLVSAVASGGKRVIILGQNQMLLQADEAELLVREADLPVTAGTAAFLPDGRWVVGSGNMLYFEGEEMPVELCCKVEALAVDGTRVAAAHSTGVSIYDTADESTSFMLAPRDAVLPPVLAAYGGKVFFAAPEWEYTLAMEDVPVPLPSHEVFSADEVLDAALWTVSPPRRVLVGSDYGLVEAASIGGRAGLSLHTSSGETRSISLQGGVYVGGAAQGPRVYLLSSDRKAYRSMVVEVAIDGEEPEVTVVESFTGVGTGITVDDGRLYVADADRGMRLYDVSGGELLLGGIFDPGEMP